MTPGEMPQIQIEFPETQTTDPGAADRVSATDAGESPAGCQRVRGNPGPENEAGGSGKKAANDVSTSRRISR